MVKNRSKSEKLEVKHRKESVSPSASFSFLRLTSSFSDFDLFLTIDSFKTMTLLEL